MPVSFMEIPFCGLYFPPLLPIVTGGLAGAMVTRRVLEACNLMQRFWHPMLVVTALAAGYSALLTLITTTP